MVKKLVYSLLMVCFTLILLEALAFTAVQLVDREDFFDNRSGVMARFDESALALFKSSTADPITGWRNIGPRVKEENNCLGEPVSATYDAAGARIYPGFDPAGAEIVVVGDSYTNGEEANDAEAFPAQLAGLLGTPVANHGVGGYGPTQSLLNLQQNISRYPQARVVVLGVMYENLYRMVNSYRPVLYGTSSDYTLKPYMASGRIVPHPGAQALESIEQHKVAAEKAFDNDFWARPVARFPYSLALVRSLRSNYFLYRRLQRNLRDIGKPEYFMIFEDAEIEANLVALLNQYADMSRAWDVQPVVVFIPRNSLDVSSAGEFIARNRAELDASLVIGDVAASEGLDWMRFNLREERGDNICHPSAYGYQEIAKYVAGLLRQSGVSSEP